MCTGLPSRSSLRDCGKAKKGPPSLKLRRDSPESFRGELNQKWRRANSRPDPVFKYLSKARAFLSEVKATAVSIFQGLNFAVCGQLPRLWPCKRLGRLRVTPV